MVKIEVKDLQPNSGKPCVEEEEPSCHDNTSHVDSEAELPDSMPLPTAHVSEFNKSSDFLTQQVAEESLRPDSSLALADCSNSLEDETVDVSPSGYTLSALEKLAEKEKDHVVTQGKKIYVFDNKFTIIPPSIGRFKYLKCLKFFSNVVKMLPDEVCDLAHLEHLQMKVHPIGLGDLPPLGNLSSLKVLELQQAPLRPSLVSLPRDISRLNNLKRLAVCNFSIAVLPPEICNLKNLEELDLSFNRLRNFPKQVSSLEALRRLQAGNNRLIELPSELTRLPNLISIDVSHNRLTSLESMDLLAMTSLRALDAKFNRIHRVGTIPNWITCNLEGNFLSVTACNVSSSEDDSLEAEAILFDTETAAPPDENCSIALPLSSFSREKGSQKQAWHAKSKKGWKRHDNEQQKARHDKLNISRKSQVDVSNDNENFVRVLGTAMSAEGKNGEQASNSHAEKTGNVHERRMLPHSGVDVACDASETLESFTTHDSHSVDNAATSSGVSCSSTCEHEVCGTSNEFDTSIVDHGKDIVTHNSRKVITGYRCSWHAGKETIENLNGMKYTFKSKEREVHEKNSYRRKISTSDKNPKPTKRRKAVENLSDISYIYHSQSFCGFGDRLQDGFYDAGREYPFSSLDVLASEQLSLGSREVILVDRKEDEELDVIALSAQQFLAALELPGLSVGKPEDCRLNGFQKAAILALYVSDCFGGSDKTLNIAHARRAALGGLAGVPFVCSCSYAGNSSILSRSSEGGDFQGAIPSLQMLCEGTINILKIKRGSNVLPIGSLPYGVCRHRAILFKYLCDRLSIPCELVRGYLDYMPHAWNVILAYRGSADVRMLVDACRPLDIRDEQDPEYFCRYIPLKRIHLPRNLNINAGESGNAAAYQLLPEEIGRGASGSVVYHCWVGSILTAAKVHSFDQASDASFPDIADRWLSELRLLCSLEEHPCIVSFYGHHFSSAPVASRSKKGVIKAQLVIFMEYVKGGSLEAVIKKWREQGQTHMPVRHALYIARDVAHALSFLHSKSILHRDIKSSNILVDVENETLNDSPLVKLCDFDRAVPLSFDSSSHYCYLAHRGVPTAEVCVGTPSWMAPEVLRAMYEQHAYGLEADIWSYGCLLFELLTLRVPYSGLSDSEVHSHIQRGSRPKLPVDLESVMAACKDKSNARLSTEDVDALKMLVRLFNSCTESCPSDRPTAFEIYETLRVFASEKLDMGPKIPLQNLAALDAELPSPRRGLEVSENPTSANNTS